MYLAELKHVRALAEPLRVPKRGERGSGAGEIRLASCDVSKKKKENKKREAVVLERYD